MAGSGTLPAGVSVWGLDFIARWEGLVLLPYNDAAGNATIGYGHLIHLGPVTRADKRRWAYFTAAKARRLLAGDVEASALAVRHMVVPPIQLQHRFDALTSFVFNVGAGAFARSTLLRLLNAGVRDRRAGDELLRWDRAGGRRLEGLARRRAAERALFLRGLYGA